MDLVLSLDTVKISNLAHTLSMGEIFSEDIDFFLQNFGYKYFFILFFFIFIISFLKFSRTFELPLDFVTPSLLAASSHLMGETKIRYNDTQSDCALYVALVAKSRIEKPNGLAIIEKSCFEIEEFENVRYGDSKIIDGN